MADALRRADVDPLDNTTDDPTVPTELVLGGHTLTSLTYKVCSIVERPKPPKAWYVAITISGALTLLLFAMIGYLVVTGIGVWGLNNPVGWGWAIVKSSTSCSGSGSVTRAL
jgi:molybdopterin-containing oxidoreductase family membrane subunit